MLGNHQLRPAPPSGVSVLTCRLKVQRGAVDGHLSISDGR
jgi:hypothetical protein